MNKLNSKLREKAVQLLAKRSYSSAQLSQKLLLFYQKLALKEHFEFDATSANHQINQVIIYCQEHRWLDDIDFLQRYIKERNNKGHGPNKIIADAMRQGFMKSAIEQQFDELEIDFSETLQSCAFKKWGLAKPVEIKEKQKRYLYLLSRGFSSDLIQFYLNKNNN